MEPKKHLGQHFLTAVGYAERIAESVLAQRDDHVLEIGPGQGALSVHLKPLFPAFHCVEIDTDVIPILKGKLGKGQWVLHQDDVLNFDFLQVGTPLHLVGNLPYSIGSMIIKKSLLYGNNIESCTFMVQREVAERIVSKPHCKSNSFLSIFCQFFGKPEILFQVPPEAFFPKPSVESSVFRLVLEKDLEKKLPKQEWEKYFAFIDRGFKMRRKMLVNVLGREGDKELYRSQLVDMGINPLSRAEDLDASTWLAFYKILCNC